MDDHGDGFRGVQGPTPIQPATTVPTEPGAPETPSSDTPNDAYRHNCYHAERTRGGLEDRPTWRCTPAHPCLCCQRLAGRRDHPWRPVGNDDNATLRLCGACASEFPWVDEEEDAEEDDTDDGTGSVVVTSPDSELSTPSTETPADRGHSENCPLRRVRVSCCGTVVQHWECRSHPCPGALSTSAVDPVDKTLSTCWCCVSRPLFPSGCSSSSSDPDSEEFMDDMSYEEDQADLDLDIGHPETFTFYVAKVTSG